MVGTRRRTDEVTFTVLHHTAAAVYRLTRVAVGSGTGAAGVPTRRALLRPSDMYEARDESRKCRLSSTNRLLTETTVKNPQVREKTDSALDCYDPTHIIAKSNGPERKKS